MRVGSFPTSFPLFPARAVLGICLLLPAACGRVGDPQPPLVRIPEAVSDFAVVQTGYDLRFSWTNPLRNLDQSTSTDVVSARIRSGEQIVAVTDPGEAGAFQDLFIPARSLLGVERQYVIEFETDQGRVSGASNPVTWTVVDVPGSGSRPSAVVDQGAVRLEWGPPVEQEALAAAYRVYRSGILRTGTPLVTPEFEDRDFEPGARYSYIVVPVRAVEGSFVEGDAYPELMVVAEDRTAPETPSGVRILPNPGFVFIQWDPVTATDLERYRVYRRAGPAAIFEAVDDGEHSVTVFSDSTPPAGAEYVVSAVDDSGNESGTSVPVQIP